MTIDARPHALVARLVDPLIPRMLGKSIASDLDAIKADCETAA